MSEHVDYQPYGKCLMLTLSVDFNREMNISGSPELPTGRAVVGGTKHGTTVYRASRPRLAHWLQYYETTDLHPDERIYIIEGKDPFQFRKTW